jgi:hypothetical protein
MTDMPGPGNYDSDLRGFGKSGVSAVMSGKKDQKYN